FHNNAVKRYFAHRNDDLLVVNLSEKNAAQRIVEFIGLPYKGQTIPHLNRSFKPPGPLRSPAVNGSQSTQPHKELSSQYDALARAYDFLLIERDAFAEAHGDLVVQRNALERSNQDADKDLRRLIGELEERNGRLAAADGDLRRLISELEERN